MSGLFGGSTKINGETPQAIATISLQTSAYGVPIAIQYGTNRLSPNVIDYQDFQAIANTTTTNTGGKGGGGTSVSNTTYTYQAAVVMALCEGSVAGIGQVWVGKALYSDISNLPVPLSLFAGTLGQSAWSYMTTNHPSHALGYTQTAYVAAAAYQLTSSAGLDNHSFEIKGFKRFILNPSGSPTTSPDANPADVIYDLLVSTQYGAGWNPGLIASTTNAINYCGSLGLLISPTLDTQKSTSEWIKSFAEAGNIGLVWSEGVLKMVPYGDSITTGNGYTFTPNTTPIYDLTDDDFVVQGSEDPIEVEVKDQADCYNSVRLEYCDRSNQYNKAIAEAKDQGAIDKYGLRVMSTVQAHFICDPNVARIIVQLILQLQLYVRNTYTFHLNWSKCLLEPMDLVTLTDSGLGLNKTPVRITEIEEDEFGELSVTAEDWPFGAASATLYPTTSGTGFAHNYNVNPGNANTPIVFEPPLELTGVAQIWIATSGGADWGGCNIWVSSDNTNYEQVGTMHGSSRHGTTTAIFASGSDPDVTNTIAVDLSVSSGTLISGTTNDRDVYNTLCYVSGELISYQTATLTSANHYNITSLRRGAYGTNIASHSNSSAFARLDDAIGKFDFAHYQAGQSLYIKLQSFNKYGSGVQPLTSLTPSTYAVVGSALVGTYSTTNDNLIPNGNSEQGLAAKNIIPDGNGLTLGNAFVGSWCRSFAIVNGGSQSTSLYVTDTRQSGFFTRCSVGESFYFEAQLKSSASLVDPNNVLVAIEFLGVSSTLAVYSQAVRGGITTSYQFASASGMAPAGTIGVAFYIVYSTGSGSDTGKIIYADELLAKRQTKVEHLTSSVSSSINSSFYCDFSDVTMWDSFTPSDDPGTFIATSVSDSIYGQHVGRSTNQTYKVLKNAIPFDKDVLYRITARIRQESDPSSGQKNIYIGMFSYANESDPYSSYLVDAVWYVASNITITAGSSWTSLTGYVSGRNTGGTFAQATNPANPSPVHGSARFIRPAFVFNYVNSTGGGVVDIDQFTVEIMANPTGWINTSNVTDNAISTLTATYTKSASGPWPADATTWKDVLTHTVTTAGGPLLITGTVYVKGTRSANVVNDQIRVTVDGTPYWDHQIPSWQQDDGSSTGDGD